MSRFTTKTPALFFGIILSACLAGDGAGPGDGSGGTNPGYPGAGTGSGGDSMPGAVMSCFFPEDDPNAGPIATIEHVLEVFEDQDAVHVRLTLDPNFVDNTYGDGSLGWGNRGHTFADIYRSDHAELVLTDGNGDLAVQFKVDYLSADDLAPSGWASLGVDSGDGEMIAGDRASILATRSSLDRNLNERGYASYTSSSPITDENYSPDPAAPEWDFRYVFEAWVAIDAFGSAGLGDVTIEYIHASPAKTSDDTVVVEPDPCPPDWDPDCNDPDGCDGEPNPPGDPDCNDPDGCDGEPNPPGDPDCNDPDGCDGEPNDPDNNDPPVECVDDNDCSNGEFCNEGTCQVIIG
jgi:hypothetical protein